MKGDRKSFIMVPEWLPYAPKAYIKHTHVKVLMCLLNHRRGKETCCVAAETIQTKTHMCNKVVWAAIGVWLDLGVIRRDKQFNNSNVYRFDDHLLYHGEPDYSQLPTFQAMRKAEAKKIHLHRIKGGGVGAAVAPITPEKRVAYTEEKRVLDRIDPKPAVEGSEGQSLPTFDVSAQREPEIGRKEQGKVATPTPAPQPNATAAGPAATGVTAAPMQLDEDTVLWSPKPAQAKAQAFAASWVPDTDEELPW